MDYDNEENYVADGIKIDPIVKNRISFLEGLKELEELTERLEILKKDVSEAEDEYAAINKGIRYIHSRNTLTERLNMEIKIEDLRERVRKLINLRYTVFMGKQYQIDAKLYSQTSTNTDIEKAVESLSYMVDAGDAGLINAQDNFATTEDYLLRDMDSL